MLQLRSTHNMGVSVDVWRARIGGFLPRAGSKLEERFSFLVRRLRLHNALLKRQESSNKDSNTAHNDSGGNNNTSLQPSDSTRAHGNDSSSHGCHNHEVKNVEGEEGEAKIHAPYRKTDTTSLEGIPRQDPPLKEPVCNHGSCQSISPTTESNITPPSKMTDSERKHSSDDNYKCVSPRQVSSGDTSTDKVLPKKTEYCSNGHEEVREVGTQKPIELSSEGAAVPCKELLSASEGEEPTTTMETSFQQRASSEAIAPFQQACPSSEERKFRGKCLTSQGHTFPSIAASLTDRMMTRNSELTNQPATGTDLSCGDKESHSETDQQTLKTGDSQQNLRRENSEGADYAHTNTLRRRIRKFFRISRSSSSTKYYPSFMPRLRRNSTQKEVGEGLPHTEESPPASVPVCGSGVRSMGMSGTIPLRETQGPAPINEMLLVRAGDVELNPGPNSPPTHALMDLELSDLAKEVPTDKFMDLGQALGRSSVDCNNILEEHHSNFEDSLREILVAWRDRQGATVNCREELAKKLHVIDLDSLGERLREGQYPSLGAESSESPPRLTDEEIASCKQALREFYKEKEGTTQALRELTVYDGFLDGLQSRNATLSMLFPSLQKLTLITHRTVNVRTIQLLAHSTVRELLICNGHPDSSSQVVSVTGEPAALSQALILAFPVVERFRVKDLMVGNTRCEAMLRNLRNHTCFTSASFEGCYVDDELDQLCEEIREQNKIQVDIQHGPENLLLDKCEMSRNIVDALYHRTSVRKLTLCRVEIPDDAFAGTTDLDVDSQIEVIRLDGTAISSQSACRELARFIGQLSSLANFSIEGELHLCDEFYETLQMMAPSLRHAGLKLNGTTISSPSACRDLGRFIGHYSCHNNLEMEGELHLNDEFYAGLAEMAPSLKEFRDYRLDHANLKFNGTTISSPSACRDLARFIGHYSCLNNLEMEGELHLNDEFYAGLAEMAPSLKEMRSSIVKIAGLKLTMTTILSPSACRDLARFICDYSYHNNLEMEGELHLNDEFYAGLAEMAPPLKMVRALLFEEFRVYRLDKMRALRSKEIRASALYHANLKLNGTTISSPSACRDLARFISHYSCLNNLEMEGELHLNDEFYAGLAEMAPSLKMMWALLFKDIRDYRLDKMMAPSFEEIRDDPLEEIRDDYLEEIRDDYLEEIRDDYLEEIRDDYLEEIRDDYLEKMRASSVGKMRAPSVGEIRDDYLESMSPRSVSRRRAPGFDEMRADLLSSMSPRSVRRRRAPGFDEMRADLLYSMSPRSVRRRRAPGFDEMRADLLYFAGLKLNGTTISSPSACRDLARFIGRYSFHNNLEMEGELHLNDVFYAGLAEMAPSLKNPFRQTITQLLRKGAPHLLSDAIHLEGLSTGHPSQASNLPPLPVSDSQLISAASTLDQPGPSTSKNMGSLQGKHTSPAKSEPRNDSITKMIGRQGGKLQLEKYGVSVAIPSEALESPEEITLQIAHDVTKADVEDVEMSASHSVKLSPDGLRFKQPVRVLLPHCAIFRKPSDVQVILRHITLTNENVRRIDRISLPQNDASIPSCHLTRTDIEIRIQHFSTKDILFYMRHPIDAIMGKTILCEPFMPKCSECPIKGKLHYARLCIYDALPGNTQVTRDNQASTYDPYYSGRAPGALQLRYDRGDLVVKGKCNLTSDIKPKRVQRESIFSGLPRYIDFREGVEDDFLRDITFDVHQEETPLTNVEMLFRTPCCEESHTVKCSSSGTDPETAEPRGPEGDSSTQASKHPSKTVPSSVLTDEVLLDLSKTVDIAQVPPGQFSVHLGLGSEAGTAQKVTANIAENQQNAIFELLKAYRNKWGTTAPIARQLLEIFKKKKMMTSAEHLQEAMNDLGVNL